MDDNPKFLSCLHPGETGIVLSLNSEGRMRRRLQDLGVIEGTKIKCEFRAPFGEPTAYEIRGTLIALRSDDTDKIYIQSPERK